MPLLKLLLFPFSLLYGMVTRLRNHLYDIGYKRSFSFDTVVLSVGNLSVGGTGKSPMVEYLIRLLQDRYKVCTLSRGYGRRTRGFRLAKAGEDARTLGDEPYQFYQKFSPRVRVAIGEERALAIPCILTEFPDNEVIIMDDAYQHRTVRPDFSLLLTSYARPFFNDRLLPSGRLRESRKGARRADALIVTKCPECLEEADIQQYTASARNYLAEGVPVYFTQVRYLAPRPVLGKPKASFSGMVFLFTGIANAQGLKAYVEKNFTLLGFKDFNDHHRYTTDDIRRLKASLRSTGHPEACFLTTEKDGVKLQDFDFEGIPLFYLPIETHFVQEGARAFDAMILDTIAKVVSAGRP